MTRAELKSQVTRRLFVGKQPIDAVKNDVSSVIDEVLAPYDERDRLAAERKQAPFQFGPQSVTWLERLVRQRVKI